MTALNNVYVRWTCYGPVTGRCCILHRTIGAAVKCCARHHRFVRSGHGPNAYSDRSPGPVRPDGGALSDDATAHAFDAIYRGAL